MDEQIIELMKGRNDDGMKLLTQHYGGMLQYIVGSILIDSRDTEECISDICMTAWNKIDLYNKAKGRFSTWLTAIARNTALNYKKRKSFSCEELSEEISTSSTPEMDMLKKERNAQLEKIIRTLSKSEQHLFYRKYYYLQSSAQIAAELGKTERSVEGKLYRLRKKLQGMLGGELDD